VCGEKIIMVNRRVYCTGGQNSAWWWFTAVKYWTAGGVLAEDFVETWGGGVTCLRSISGNISSQTPAFQNVAWTKHVREFSQEIRTLFVLGKM